MPIQTIDRGTPGNTGDTFKVGVAFDTCQANDEYLDAKIDSSIAALTVDTFADLATTPAIVDQVVITKQHTSDGIGGGVFIGKSGSTTNNGGTLSESATAGVYWSRVLDGYICPSMFGAIMDGVADDYEALQAAIDSGIPINVGEATIRISSGLTSSSDLVFCGAGELTVIDASEVSGSALRVYGSFDSKPQISDCSRGDRSVTFLSAHGLSVGDIFVIYNPTNSSYSGFRTNYRAGEFCEVSGVSGLSVDLRSCLYSGYTGADVDIYKLSSGKVLLSGFKVLGSDSPIEVSKVARAKIENVFVENSSGSGIYLDKCFSSVISGCDVKNAGSAGDDYGIIIGNSQHIKIESCFSFARRHAVATGGDAEVCCVPCRDIRINNCTLKNDFNSGTHCADFHGNTEDSSYESCSIYGGVSWQGSNNSFINCNIYAMQGGIIEYASEILGGNFTMDGCKIFTYEDPSDVTRGVIDVGGNSSVITTNTAEDCTFIVSKCAFYGRNFSNITSLFILNIDGGSVKVNIRFDNNTVNVDDLGQIIRARVNSGSCSPDFIIIDGNFGLPDPILLGNFDSSFSNAPLRMQSCGGSVEKTSSTSSPGVQETVSFRYIYPRPPFILVTKSNRNYSSNRIGVAIADTVTESDATIAVYTDDATNFSSALSLKINWTAFINDI